MKRKFNFIYKYRARRFIAPFELKGVFENVNMNKKYIAIPTKLFEKYNAIKVIVGDESMTIWKTDKPLGYRRFPDKFGREKFYTLAYYEWKIKIKL